MQGDKTFGSKLQAKSVQQSPRNEAQIPRPAIQARQNLGPNPEASPQEFSAKSARISGQILGPVMPAPAQATNLLQLAYRDFRAVFSAKPVTPVPAQAIKSLQPVYCLSPLDLPAWQQNSWAETQARKSRALHPASLILSSSWFTANFRLIYQHGW